MFPHKAENSKRLYKIQEEIELPKQKIEKEYENNIIPNIYEKTKHAACHQCEETQMHMDRPSRAWYDKDMRPRRLN
jgi:hypothetical protein